MWNLMVVFQKRFIVRVNSLIKETKIENNWWDEILQKDSNMN